MPFKRLSEEIKGNYRVVGRSILEMVGFNIGISIGEHRLAASPGCPTNVRVVRQSDPPRLRKATYCFLLLF
jgi:hypothetical protein